MNYRHRSIIAKYNRSEYSHNETNRGKNTNPPLLGKKEGLIGLGGLAIATLLGLVGKNKQEKIRKERQKKVNDAGDDAINRYSVNNDNEVLSYEVLHSDERFEEIEIKDSQTFMSSIFKIGGEGLKAALTSLSYNGLLKCDVPIGELAKVKGEPGSMRGYSTKNGKIEQQGKFKIAGMKEASPLLIFQALSVITSQYYLDNIYSELQEIEKKLQQLKNDKIEEKETKLYRRCEQLLNKYARSNDSANRTTIDNIVMDCWDCRDFFLNQLKKHIDIKFAFRERLEVKDTTKEIELKIRFFRLFHIATWAILYAEYLLFRLASSSDEKNLHIDEMNKAFCSLNDGEREFKGRRAEIEKHLSICKEKSWFGYASIDEMEKRINRELNKVEKDSKEEKRKMQHELIKIPVYIRKKGEGRFAFVENFPKT